MKSNLRVVRVWMRVKLTDVCRPKQYKTLSKNDLNENGQYFVYGANGIIGKADVYTHKNQMLLITCRGATCGSINLSEPYSYINGNAMTLDNLSNDVNLQYLYYQLCQYNFHKIITGTAQPQITRQSLNKLVITVAPLTQQKKIAHTLDKAKELIELRKKSIEKLDALAKSLFVDMFGDPVENSMGWEITKLSTYGTLARGKSSHRPRNAPELYGGSYPFIQTGDVSNGNNIYLSQYKQTYSELGIQQSRLFKKGVIAIAIAANIGNAKILSLDCYFPDSVVGFETDCSEFSLFLLSFYKEQLDSRATKTAQKNINLKILNDLDVIDVPLPLQQKFAKTIQKIESQKSLYEKELAKLEENFEALLAKSFG